jgi:hypothetical protein
MGEVTSIRTARRQTANGRAATHMEKLLAEARLKLIETGTRKPPHSYPAGSQAVARAYHHRQCIG